MARHHDRRGAAGLRILVTGAAGMVGSYVREEFAGDDCIETSRRHGSLRLDVRDAGSVASAIARARPDVVLHLAAMTDVDDCELHPVEAYRTNAAGTRHVAVMCGLHDLPLVYISTAVVFAGDGHRPYTETDEPRPANLYGRTKLAGERFVSGLARRHLIVRTTWLMGGGDKDKKFVGVVARRIASGSAPIQAVDDKVGSPTYARDLLRTIRVLLASERYGVYHVVNSGRCSRFELALAVRDVMGRPDVAIEPVSSSRFPLAAPRADSEVLAAPRLQLAGVPCLRPWQEALHEYYRRELGPSLVSAAVPMLR